MRQDRGPHIFSHDVPHLRVWDWSNSQSSWDYLDFSVEEVVLVRWCSWKCVVVVVKFWKQGWSFKSFKLSPIDELQLWQVEWGSNNAPVWICNGICVVGWYSHYRWPNMITIFSKNLAHELVSWFVKRISPKPLNIYHSHAMMGYSPQISMWDPRLMSWCS
jgi:hypothetical protein